MKTAAPTTTALIKAANACSASEPVDPRVRRTRQLLEEAFRSLVKQKAFTEISVQDITDYATVNRATFYAHYTDKQDLASSVVRHDFHQSVMRQFNERPAFTADNMIGIALAVFEFLANARGICPNAAKELPGSIGETLQDELYRMMDRWLSLTSAHARLFPNCSKATVATVISSSIYGGALRWSRSPRREPAEEVCREIVSMLMPSAR